MKNQIWILGLIMLLATPIKAQQDSLLRCVSSQKEMDLRDAGLLAMPSQGVFMIAGNTLSSVDTRTRLSQIDFPSNIHIDNIIWSGEDLIIRSGNEVYLIDELEEPLMEFDMDDYEIFPKSGDDFFLVAHSRDSSILFVGDINRGKVKRILKIGEFVLHVSESKSAVMVATNRLVYVFTEDECKRYLTFEAPVHSAVMTSKGLVFATEDMVCLLVGEGTFVPLFEAKTRQLLYDYKELYMLLDNGDLWAFDIDGLKLF